MQIGNHEAFLLDALKRELLARSKRNPRYSLRAYARSLGVDQSLLTKIIAGKRLMGRKTQLRLTQALGLPLRLTHPMAEELRQATFLTDETLELLSGWIHFALLELLQIPGQSHEVGGLASAIDCSRAEIRDALERLERLGHLRKEGRRWLVVTTSSIWATQKNTTEARKRMQKQLLAKAIDAVDKYELELRENFSLTVATDPAVLPEIKARIRSFQAELNSFIESRGNLKDVYQLCIAFYPLSRRKTK